MLMRVGDVPSLPSIELGGERIMSGRYSLRAVCVAGLMTIMSAPLSAQYLLEDEFTSFELGTVWQALGGAAPDLSLGVAGVGADGASLRVGSSPGAAGEIVGIETISPISLLGVPSLRVEALVRPLNQTGAGDGGASDASVGIAVIGSSGAYAQASAGANRPEAPDWGDFYQDSEGSQNAASVAFLHFPPNDPSGGAEAFRTFVLEIGSEGTRLTTLGTDGTPLADPAFDIFNPSLTLENFGDTATIALFQERSDSTLSGTSFPENVFGDIDRVTVQAVPEPTSWVLLFTPALGWAALRKRRQ